LELSIQLISLRSARKARSSSHRELFNCEGKSPLF